MKLPSSYASSSGLSIGLRAGVAAVTLWACQLEVSAAAELTIREDEEIFQSPRVLRIAVDIPEEGMQTLRHSQPKRSAAIKPKAQARVTEGGRVYTNVAVQLKGFSSFQPVDGMPGLTLNFDKLAPKQRFHGLSKISLNNSVQDRTLLHEKFSRELFAAAAVPVPRADHAVVTLNGRDLGLYVLAEGFDKEFLKRHFKRADGNLYDGGVLQDIDRGLQFSSGQNPTNHAGVERLIRAAREPDPDARFRALESALDVDRFLSMVAMETILCHSDSYSMNRNNYRLYHDPSTDKIVFMPHGMDRVLGTHRSSLDLPIVPPMLGLVARATLSTPEGRRRYLERAGVLFTNLFQSDRLGQRVHEIQARLVNDLMDSGADRRNERARRQIRLQDAENLCERITARAADLKMQFTYLSEIQAAPPVPRFGPNGVAQIQGWKPKRSVNQPDISYQIEDDDGAPALHLRLPTRATTAAVHCLVSLPAGHYRLTGQIRVTGSENDGPALPISGAVLRYSSYRFAAELQPLNWSDVNLPLQVAENRAPEEIELICQIMNAPHDVWIDASSLRLVRVAR